MRVPLAAVHVYGRVASLVTRVGVVEQQSVRAQLFREFAVGGAMVVQVALYLVRIESRFFRTLEIAVLLLSERQAYNDTIVMKRFR